MDRLALMKLFVDICERGSMAAVARQRGQSPSLVTQALQKLEQQVGAKLIVRTTRAMHLTAEGEQFRDDSERILAEYDKALERISGTGSLSGTIRLTATNDFGRTRLPRLIDQFLIQHPEVKFELVLSDGVLDLVDERFDLAIRHGPMADPSLTSRRLVSTHRVVCAAPAYWQDAGRPQHPSELSSHQCMVLARPGAPQNHWEFQEAGQVFSVTVAGNRMASDGGALREWAIAGAGVIFKSMVDVAEDIEVGRLEVVLNDYRIPEVNLYAVFPEGRYASRRISTFIEFLHDKLGSEREASHCQSRASSSRA